MVIDTSTLVAILTQEKDAAQLASAIEGDEMRFISAATLTEASIVVTAMFGEQGGADLDEMIEQMEVEVVPLTEDHARLAREAYVRYGKGRHPAKLNFGDCFPYALAKATGHPLLFKGNDFSQTDIEVVAVASPER